MYRYVRLLPAVVLVALYGCNVAVEGPSSSSSKPATAAASPGSGVSSGFVETASGRYVFTPKTCVIHHEGGVPDVEIGGAGKAPDGEKIYVDVSSTADELSIELGVDTPFAAAERTLRASRFASKLEISGQTLRVADLELVDDQGQRQPASLQIDCRAG